MGETARIILGGDVMLGRIVKERIRSRGPSYPLGRIAATMRRADLTLVNLECAVTASERRWQGVPKVFYFGAPPEAIQTLRSAGVDLVSLANNHVLDYGEEGLNETLQLLRKGGIAFAGAGADLAEASAPVFIERGGVKMGMVAYCDHQEDFAAGESRPGINHLDLEDEDRVVDRFRRDLDRMREAGVDWPILSLHWGPNMVERPSASFVRLAHAAVEAGCGILFGHSAHVFHGIEIYKGRPIFYSAGDLVDDYYVDPEFRNDHQLLFELEVTRSELRRIHLFPVFISECRTVPAAGESFEYIAQRIAVLCGEMGTRVQREGRRAWIDGRNP